MTTRPVSIFMSLLAVLILLAAALACLRVLQRPRFAYSNRSLAPHAFAVLAAKPGWQQSRINVIPGVQLLGLLRKPRVPGAPWILFFSGNSADLLQESQQFLEALCAQRGWGAAVWAYRGFDSSDGVPQPGLLERDAFTVYRELLKDQHLFGRQVHLVGFSLGTSIAASLAARSDVDPPASLTMMAPMTVVYLGERLQVNLDRYETLKSLPRISVPTLVVHGVEDTTLKIENGRAVAAALGGHARLVEVPKVGHADLLSSAVAQGAVIAFIEKNSMAEAVPARQ